MTPGNPEEWRPAPIRADLYEVSSYGRVRNRRTGLVLKPYWVSRERRYLRVCLGRQHVKVHVLVCETFHGRKPTPLHEVAHGNGDSIDNRASNLRWATPKENYQDRVNHGRASTLPHPVGTESSQAKLTDDAVREIRRSSLSQRQLAALFGVERTTIRKVLDGRGWKHVV